MEGLIRKIIIGIDPKNALAYYVGMKAGENEVSAIVDDDRSLHKFGKRRYFVYVQDQEGETKLWKVVEDAPTIIEFDLKF